MKFALSLIGILTVVAFAVLACKRHRWRLRVCVVESWRVLLVTAAIGLLWQPESRFRVGPENQSDVVLLRDGSASMQTLDVPSDGELASRNEVAGQIGDDVAWQELNPRFRRTDRQFAAEPNSISDLGEAIDRAAQRNASAAALVVVSDGDWNGQRSPVQAAADLMTRSSGKSPVFAISIGGADRLPDLELLSAGVPTFGVVGKPVRIPFAVRNWFGDLREAVVTLGKDGDVIERQTIPLRSGDRFEGAFTWRSEAAGTWLLSVEVALTEGEVNESNNRIEKTIEIREEKLRVLIIEAVPRWEYRYLRNALLRDPGIDVSCLLFHPSLPDARGGGKGYLSALPDEPAEWASYDVIFLGDVGVMTDQLTVEQCRQIRGLVEQQAVGLVLMPGPQGNQSSLLQSDLGELFPVVLDSAIRGGVGDATPASFALTDAGRKSLLTQLDDDRQANWSVWEDLPGFYWHAGVARAKAGSQVLAVHATSGNEFGRLPLLVSRPAGAGKVLFMGTDSAWRWRMGVEDKYHYRFWGQAIRWMAYQRNMAVGQTMRFSYRPEQPQRWEAVSLRASVMTREGTPSDADAVIVEVSPPDGSTREVRLDRTDSEWGVYVGQTSFGQVGEHVLTLSHPTEEAAVTARVAVQGRAVEQIGRPARPDIMREVARVGGGKMFTFDQIGQLVNHLNRLPPDPSSLRRIEWWNHPAVLLAMVAGLCLFWIGRKWVGSI